MNVRRMLPTLLREVEPSIPTMEPLTIPATGALTVLKSSLMFCLQQKLTFNHSKLYAVEDIENSWKE
jgi:hypothetical protein